ncbi:hypothetical protein J3P71_17755 [Rhizobium leguminosarum]|uniref:hypothetical protein n=1 Tax=Rhizobium leguminosarum TaxID=384 RepID=UPI0014418FE8|nr:hypothetical protein [Rhizobium leguminosarum]MBY5838077.1 hypothetical protein [Rhizobium leguminosarum]NKM82235.1 hypothetical protein [Rhizobium leguminosarum bv. viciae]QSZ06714.1 hypothetical protein J3P71_17755 [Rhizobium leguminosarum]
MSRAPFFAVDRRCWRAACDLGMNEAVAYLVIASGTGGDQRTSSWSATSIEVRTGIHHRRATGAIDNLVGAGLMTVEKRGKRRSYFLKPANEVPAVVAKTITPARRAREKCQEALEELENPQWIWLPNALVEGAADETPPVKLLRQSQNLKALRLFIDLYFYHDLADCGGIEWHRGIGIRQPFTRREIGRHGIYVVWAFKPDPTTGSQTYKNAPFWFEGGFWDAWNMLLSAGLVEFVAHLVESDGDVAEVIHPLPWANGEDGEKAITIAAIGAGRRMAPFFDDERTTMLIPVSKLRPDVELIGIARMKYRPQTARTSEWLAKANEWRKTALAFDEMAATVEDSGIKVVSR